MTLRERKLDILLLFPKCILLFLKPFLPSRFYYLFPLSSSTNFLYLFASHSHLRSVTVKLYSLYYTFSSIVTFIFLLPFPSSSSSGSLGPHTPSLFPRRTLALLNKRIGVYSARECDSRGVHFPLTGFSFLRVAENYRHRSLLHLQRQTTQQQLRRRSITISHYQPLSTRSVSSSKQ